MGSAGVGYIGVVSATCLLLFSPDSLAQVTKSVMGFGVVTGKFVSQTKNIVSRGLSY